ncbi:hypothetical protein LguiB_033445 [Lonicera macranthoides]
MKLALRLGFHSFFNINSCALGPKNLKVTASFGPQRKFSNSVAVLAKLTKSMSIKPADENGDVKESIVKSKVDEMEGIGKDSVERMTVQELRLKLRSLGVPAKGCKGDLVSALKSTLNQKDEGEDSLVVDHHVSPNDKPIYAKHNSKRKAKKASDKDHAESISTDSEVSGTKRTKTRVEKAQVEDSVVEVETTLFAMKQEPSIKTSEATGTKFNQSKIKLSSEITSGDLGALDWVDVSETQNEAWTILAHKKPQKGWIPYNPRTVRPPPLTADTKHVKLMSWNVNGLRALLKLEGFSALQLAQREGFDVLCLQETKIQASWSLLCLFGGEKDVEAIKQSLLEGYESSFWTCSVSKLGYSGTAIISRIKPLSVRYGLGISDHDGEGRLVTVEFDSFYLLCGYVPNSGDGLKRLELEKSKPVILTGDLNCAHQEIDIYNPAGNKRSAGFTIEERQSFETNFLNKGFVDTFRRQHPGVVAYTYWGFRHGGRKNNRGWRLDYFLVSESIADKVHDSYILPDVTGSDHCPIGLVLKL